MKYVLTTLENKIISKILKPILLKINLIKTLMHAEIIPPKELPLPLPKFRNIIPGITLIKPSIKNKIEFPNNIHIFLTPYTKTFRTLVNKFLLLWINSGIMRIPKDK